MRPDGELVAGFKSGLHHVVLDDDATVTSSRIDRVDGNRDDVRFNDATSDAEGRIWACTLGGTPEEPLGTYYCYDAELNRRTVDDGYLVANGPALSPDGSLLYTVETSGHPGRQKGVYVSRITPEEALDAQRLLIPWDDVRLLPRRGRHGQRRKPLARRVPRQRSPLLQLRRRGDRLSPADGVEHHEGGLRRRAAATSST